MPSELKGVNIDEFPIVCGWDMTVEATLAKLGYLLGKGHSPKEVR